MLLYVNEVTLFTFVFRTTKCINIFLLDTFSFDLKSLMVRDNPKILDDGGDRDTQNLKEGVGDLIPTCEISSLLDGKLARWSTASCALALACRPSVSNLKNKTKKKKLPMLFCASGSFYSCLF
jgi:hypothetical protein